MVQALLLAQRLVHGAVEVERRIQMRAIVGGQRDLLHGPAFAVGQVFLLQAGKERLDLADRVLVGEVLDLGLEGGRIGDDIVLQVDGQIDEAARHGGIPVCVGECGCGRAQCAATGSSAAAVLPAGSSSTTAAAITNTPQARCSAEAEGGGHRAQQQRREGGDAASHVEAEARARRSWVGNSSAKYEPISPAKAMKKANTGPSHSSSR